MVHSVRGLCESCTVGNIFVHYKNQIFGPKKLTFWICKNLFLRQKLCGFFMSHFAHCELYKRTTRAVFFVSEIIPFSYWIRMRCCCCWLGGTKKTCQLQQQLLIRMLEGYWALRPTRSKKSRNLLLLHQHSAFWMHWTCLRLEMTSQCTFFWFGKATHICNGKKKRPLMTTTMTTSNEWYSHDTGP